MAQISLRAYLREIDNLVERELLDEAIAHCRHILQIYPKNIEIYRLLGKSYLEAKRYGDAADIFQRVLSAVPDDFVSHIGMSIVREDEGNLDSAIWHMERAFETNPANPAIQQELRRLIGRRDGFEPHKVRLTRGALARMYAQGELYPQAIAELQSALQEDPDRPDLQVLLADMYWQTGQKMEAADVSRQIIEKLPYCQRAARIMAAVHQEQGKSDEGTAYHRRLAQLDPYAAYVEYPMVDTVKVEADTIRIDRLDWRPGQPLPVSEGGQPDWAASLGVEIESGAASGGSTGPLPSWLDEIEPSAESLEIEDDEAASVPSQSASDAPMSEAADAAAFTADESIPGWMREAGWQESSGVATEAPVSFSEGELASLERGELLPESELDDSEVEDLAPAEIPSWLQGKAPGDEAPRVIQPAMPSDEDDVSDWLDGVSTSGEQVGPAEPEAAGADLTPDWLGQLADEAEDLSEPAEMPDFGLELDIEPEAAGETGSDRGAIPGWLDEAPGATSTIMSWLGGRGQQAGEAESEPGEAPAGEVPDWMQDALQGEASGPQAAPEAQASTSEDVPAWLSGVAQAAADSGFGEPESVGQYPAEVEESPADENAEAGGGEVPDWLLSIAGGSSAEEASQVVDQDAAAGFDFEAGHDAEEDVTGEETVRAPSWVSTPEPVVSDADAGFPEEEEAARWLESLTGAADELGASGVEEAAETQGSATAWLENLAEESEDVLPASPLGEEEPEWMRGLGDEETGDEALGELASSWLEGLADTLAETPAEPEAAAPGEADEGVPNWLLDYEAGTETSTDAEAAGPQPSAEETLVGPSAVFGLGNAPEGPAEGDTGRLKMLKELGLGDEPAEVSPAETSQPPADYELGQLEGMDDDQIFGWLEGLAARDQGGAPDEPGELPGEMPAAARPPEPEEPPLSQPAPQIEDLGWLEQLAEQRGIDSDVSAGVEPVPSQTTPEPAPQPSEPTIMRPRASQVVSSASEPIRTEPEAPPAPVEPPSARAEPIPEPPPTEAPPPHVTSPQPAEPKPVVPIPAEEAPRPVPPPPGPKPVVPIPAEEAPRPVPPPPEPVAPPETIRMPAAEPAGIPAGPDEGLSRARKALHEGDINQASQAYGDLIKSRREIEVVVADLESAVDRDPDAALLWQVLGDAYMKIGKTSDAVKAYNRGMKETEVLMSARQALASGDAQRASAQYGMLIKRKKHLDEVIKDLETAVSEDEDQPNIWQALGDAYMKADRLEDAIQAYRKGMGSV